VAVSPDGASVYVAAQVDRAVTAFDRAAGGGLTFDSCVADVGTGGCADPPIDSLFGARAVAVSPDSASVYAASDIDDSVTHLTREGPPGAGGGADTTPPDTTITKGPKKKSKKRKATFEFVSSEPGSTFQCKLDKHDFAPCSSPDAFKVKKGKHTFQVRAIDPAGNVDPTPAEQTWKVKKKKKK
jgi:hypothetical protein